MGTATTVETAVDSNTKRACLSHVLVSFQTRRTDGCLPVPNNEQPAHADRLGHVYSLVVTDIRVVLQVLIGYRCSVDKGPKSTCVL